MNTVSGRYAPEFASKPLYCRQTQREWRDLSHRWLITGAGGQFGSVLFRELADRGESVLGIVSPVGPTPENPPAHRNLSATRRLDIGDLDALAAAIEQAAPGIIVHAAAITNVSTAFEQPELARRVNVEATRRLCEAADEICARVVFLSTDLVFDGAAAPYAEDAPPTPLSVYGRTKAEAEVTVLECPRGLVVRPPLMYGLPGVDRPTTFVNQLKAIAGGGELRLFEDEFRAPIALADCVRSCIEAAEADIGGVLHIAGPQRLSRLEMGQIAAEALGVRQPNIVTVLQASMEFAEPRPADVSLSCRRFEEVFGRPPGRPMAEAMVEIAAAFRDAGSA